MALSDKRILEELEKGNIVIDPFRRDHLATSSYDVSLGEWFYREQPPEYNHTFYNIWNQSHMEQVWGAKEPQHARPAEEVFKKYRMEWDGICPSDLVILMRPGETILAHTQEFIGGRENITTMMKARSSMGRNFIAVCKCAGWGDVGFFNRWTMEITNSSTHYHIPLVVGRRIAQIVFFETGPILDRDYAKGGKYQGASDVETLKAAWNPSLMLPRLHKDREISRILATSRG